MYPADKIISTVNLLSYDVFCQLFGSVYFSQSRYGRPYKIFSCTYFSYFFSLVFDLKKMVDLPLISFQQMHMMLYTQYFISTFFYKVSSLVRRMQSVILYWTPLQRCNVNKAFPSVLSDILHFLYCFSPNTRTKSHTK